MRRWHRALWIVGAVLLGATAPSVALADMSGMGGTGGTIAQKTETAHYRLELDLGHPEQMFTAAEAAKMHPTSGEIMVTGKMVGPMPGMTSMSAGQGSMSDWRHLELHVINKTTGTAIEYGAVRITVTNTATGKRVDISITQMYGLKEGFPDWHYGNNVLMPPSTYTIACEANGEQATFHVSIPKM